MSSLSSQIRASTPSEFNQSRWSPSVEGVALRGSVTFSLEDTIIDDSDEQDVQELRLALVHTLHHHRHRAVESRPNGMHSESPNSEGSEYESNLRPVTMSCGRRSSLAPGSWSPRPESSSGSRGGRIWMPNYEHYMEVGDPCRAYQLAPVPEYWDESQPFPGAWSPCPCKCRKGKCHCRKGNGGYMKRWISNSERSLMDSAGTGSCYERDESSQSKGEIMASIYKQDTQNEKQRSDGDLQEDEGDAISWSQDQGSGYDADMESADENHEEKDEFFIS